MAQFTNPYNGQNGMDTYPQQGNRGNWMQPSQQPAGQISAPPTNQQMMAYQMPAPWEQQGWKDISQEVSSQSMPVRGRIVKSIDDITPQDVPMDGSLSFFPTADYSRIYAKAWGNDGRIRTFCFIPELNVPATQEKTDDIDKHKELLIAFTQSMSDRMDALESRIGDILTPFTSQSKPSTKKTTKESEQS